MHEIMQVQFFSSDGIHKLIPNMDQFGASVIETLVRQGFRRPVPQYNYPGRTFSEDIRAFIFILFEDLRKEHVGFEVRPIIEYAYGVAREQKATRGRWTQIIFYSFQDNTQLNTENEAKFFFRENLADLKEEFSSVKQLTEYLIRDLKNLYLLEVNMTLEEYVRQVIAKTHGQKLGLKGPTRFTEIETLLMLWILQKRSPHISFGNLVETLGSSREGEIRFVLDTHLRDAGFFETCDLRKNQIILKQQAMEAIATAFSDPEYHYAITETTPFFRHRRRKLTGFEFLEFMNLLDEEVAGVSFGEASSTLTRIIANAFKYSFGVDVTIPYDSEPNYSNVALIKGEDRTAFLLVAFPSQKPLNRNDIISCSGSYLPVRQWLLKEGNYGNEDLPVVIVGPSLADDETEQYMQDLEFLYHFWTIATLRFFHMVSGLENLDSKKEEMSRRLMSIFHRVKLSATTAFELLKNDPEQ